MPQAMVLTNRLRQGATRTVNQRIKEIQYGDGYREVALDGVINTYEQWDNLGWDSLNSSEQTTAYAFLNAVGQWDYVQWQPFNSATTKRYRIVDGWSETWIAGNLVNISFTLREE